MAEQNEREILQDILKSVKELMVETRKSRQDLHDIKKDVEGCYKRGELSDIGYQVRLEQIHRSHQNIDYCIRKLERQKKIALQKLSELE